MFNLQPDVYDGYHDVSLMNLSDIVFLNINGVDYCCITNGISRSEALNLMQIIDLTGKSRTL